MQSQRVAHTDSMGTLSTTRGKRLAALTMELTCHASATSPEAVPGGAQNTCRSSDSAGVGTVISFASFPMLITSPLVLLLAGLIS